VSKRIYRGVVALGLGFYVCFGGLGSAYACETCEKGKVYYDANPIKLISGLGDISFPVSTDNKEAQCFFDQGMSFIFGFHHDEAIRSFRRALELDPNLAMAHWGIAYASGPNYNIPIDSARSVQAHTEIQKALKLTDKTSAMERALITAMVVRYPSGPKADLKKADMDYRNEMTTVARTYPDDPHVATMYAESIMLLNPWRLYTLDNEPIEGTPEAVAALEGALEKYPNHIGLNHYYIHAIEASKTPEKGMKAAKALETLAPGAGHLVHMPAHIYMRIGDYESASRQNAIAVKTDSIYLKEPSVYPMMYYTHNAQFYAVGRALQGQYSDAKGYADEVYKHVLPIAKEMAMIESFAATPLLIQIRGYKWNDILAVPKPDSILLSTTAMWHFARAMAHASKGNIEGAKGEQMAFEKLIATIPADRTFSVNNAHSVYEVARHLMDGKIASADKKYDRSIAAYQRAVSAQDTLYYDEPESFYITSRESLGGALLAAEKYEQAAAVFQLDLKKHPNNARSLFGLHHALSKMGRDEDSQKALAAYESQWSNADMELKLADL